MALSKSTKQRHDVHPKNDTHLKNDAHPTGRIDVSNLIKDVASVHHTTDEHVSSYMKTNYEDFLKDSKMNFFFKNFHPKNGDTVLDVGCWIGAYTHVLSEKYPDVKFLGYDIIPEFIRLANAAFKTSNTTFVAKDVFKANELKAESFDHIFFFEVLEHVDCPRAFIELFYRLLKKGGRLYIATPSAVGMTNILLNLKHKSIKYIENEPRDTGTEKDHIYAWDKLTLYRLLNRCGFKYDKFYLSRKFSISQGQSLCFIVKK